jgi:hypothetical protein
MSTPHIEVVYFYPARCQRDVPNSPRANKAARLPSAGSGNDHLAVPAVPTIQRAAAQLIHSRCQPTGEQSW